MQVSSTQNSNPLEESKTTEQAKIKPLPEFQKLQIDGYIYYYKDTTTSKIKKQKFQFRCWKKCGVFAHVYIDYDFNRFFKEKTAPVKTLQIQEIVHQKINSASATIEDSQIIKLFNFPHKPQCKAISVEEQNIITQPTMESQSSSLISNDIKYLEKLIKSDPIKHPKFFQNQALRDNHKFTLKTIENSLTKIRKEIYPIEPELIFTSDYCRTKDTNDKACIFLQARLMFPNSKNQKQVDEIVILGSKFFIKIASEANKWFLDATFKVCPNRYYQLLILICNHEFTNTNVPCLYILMTSKDQVSYGYVFILIDQIIKQHGYNLKVTSIMSDYEEALRNSIRNIFPEAQLQGCYFHYVKALWSKASKLGLRKKSTIIDTKLLIFFMKILAHLPDEDEMKSHFWKKILLVFGSNAPFKDFLKYFEKNWLNHAIVKAPTNFREKIERTNNICETFHRRFKDFIGVVHPGLAIFVEKLLDYESILKKDTLDQIVNGSQNQISILSKNQLLPLETMEIFIEKNVEKIVCLEKALKDDEFRKQILEISTKVYHIFYGSEENEQLESFEEDQKNVEGEEFPEYSEAQKKIDSAVESNIPQDQNREKANTSFNKNCEKTFERHEFAMENSFDSSQMKLEGDNIISEENSKQSLSKFTFKKRKMDNTEEFFRSLFEKS